jgi:cytoskeletal protein RodZ
MMMPLSPWQDLPSTNSVGQFGDKFRKAREAKNISLDDVSNVTKISARMLRAIEEEHFDQLPGGVFNKGFIRAYAKHLGLNDEEAVADYLACLRQAQIDAHEVWQPERPLAQQAPPQKPPLPAYTKPAFKAQPPVQVEEELPNLQLPRAEHLRRPAQKYLDRGKNAFPWKLIAAFAVVIILAVILWIRHSRTTHEQLATRASTPSTSVPPASRGTVAVETNQPAPAKSAPNGASQSPVPATATPQSTEPANHISTPPLTKAPSGAGTNPANTTKPAATPATSPGTDNDANDVTVRTLAPSATRAKSAPTMTLVIRATENSWISVTADGQLASQETLIAPAHASIRASREIVARIGNAAGVTFLWNGQEIPAQGAEAEVKTFIFDAQGMRVASTSQPPTQNP